MAKTSSTTSATASIQSVLQSSLTSHSEPTTVHSLSQPRKLCETSQALINLLQYEDLLERRAEKPKNLLYA
jgi:hypothetical protein